MKLLMPLMIAAPGVIHGTVAWRARRAPDSARSRRLQVGLVFNICYLAAICIAVTLTLACD
jgi:hypothetical protein